jgi:lysophospholipase L1-like esterase
MTIFLSAGCATAEEAPQPVRIVCIGDSITQGGKTNRMEYTYRWPLFCLLVDSGVPFDFIGSRTSGLQEGAVWPAEYKGVAFDPDHEGVYGIKTAASLERVRTNSALWVAAPDIALIHLGTNDQKAEDLVAAVQQPLRDMVGLLRAQNPHMVILLGHLNFTEGSALKIRELVEELAAELNTPESPVRTVHHYQGWIAKPKEPGTDTFDWAHPNPQGQRKMAEKWFEAMQPWLHSAR